LSWNDDFKQKRTEYHVSQKNVANLVGITPDYLGMLEAGRRSPSEALKQELDFTVEKFNPAYQLYAIYDYIRVRFPTHEHQKIVETILQMRFNRFVCEECGRYGYRELYYYGDITVLLSDEEDNKGTLLELKGKGCRQFESILEAQGRTWIDFFCDCFAAEGVFKRVDIAINDVAGILSIPELMSKVNTLECHSIFRNFQQYISGGILKQEIEDGKIGMGHTLYIGSRKSDIYFCVYEKDYEQYEKEGIPLEDAEIKNRFEIRLSNDRARVALEDLVCYGDIERTAFGVINRYMCFYQKDETLHPDEWPLNPRWQWFMGNGREKMRLTVKPEPYTIEKTRRWIQNQVIPSLVLVMTDDIRQNKDTINSAIKQTQLSEKHRRILKQLSSPGDEVIIDDLSVNRDYLHDMDDELYDLSSQDEKKATYDQTKIPL